MKKIVYLAVLSVFILSSMIFVTACGGGTDEPVTPSEPEPTPLAPEVTIPDEPITDPTADAVVEITDDFYPKEVTIPVGGRVVWFNKGDRRWWVSSPTKTPDTGQIPVTQRMGFTFNEPGVYEYYDLYHKDVTGKVIVE